MVYPLAPLLQTLYSALAEPLVPAECRERIDHLARGVPPGYCWAALECRLHGEPQVDFAVALDGAAEQRAAARSFLSKDASLWAVRPLVDEWLQDGTILANEVPRLWIEYDMPPDSPARDFVFVSVEPRHVFAGSALGAPTERVTHLAQRALLLLGGRAAALQGVPLVAQLAETLPPGGLLRHIAITPHRGDQGLRVHATLPLRALPEWLQRIHWPGSAQSLTGLLRLCGGDFHYVGVQLSLAPTLEPYLGIELCGAAGNAQTAPWHELFKRLGAEGLCSAERAAATSTFIGRRRAQPPDAPWPITLFLSFYIKLTYRADRTPPVDAKSYLTICPQHTLI